MRLLLTSSGLANKEIRDEFLKLIGKQQDRITVAFIPTAADPEEDKWFVQSALDEINEIGMRLASVDLKGENERDLRKKLEGCDAVYVNGGNTFYLLDLVRKSGFDKVIKDLTKQGKVYIGVSAGSIIDGPDISVAGWDPSWDKNEVCLKDMKGLSLVPFVISPHFEESHRTLLEKKIDEVDYSIVPITNEQAILIDGNKRELVGLGEKITLNENN